MCSLICMGMILGRREQLKELDLSGRVEVVVFRAEDCWCRLAGVEGGSRSTDLSLMHIMRDSRLPPQWKFFCRSHGNGEREYRRRLWCGGQRLRAVRFVDSQVPKSEGPGVSGSRRIDERPGAKARVDCAA